MNEGPSLASLSPHAVLRAEDLDRAARFYADVLGLDVRPEPPPARELRVKAGDSGVICVYERPGMPPPANTVVCFEADDLRALVTELQARGVVFEEYDMPEMGLKTVDGIAEIEGHRRAWFKDSEGNILVLSEKA
jgi:predicted enzyme related to lactoylglutathione lyase